MRRCEAHLGYYPNERQCGQVVGVLAWIDYFGDTRASCVLHLRQMRRRFGTVAEADKHRAIMEATELHEGGDVPLAEVEPAWTESELRYAHGDR